MDGNEAQKDDPPTDIESWARQLVAAVGKQKARVILSDYRAISESRRSTKSDRKLADQRIQALSNCCNNTVVE